LVGGSSIWVRRGDGTFRLWASPNSIVYWVPSDAAQGGLAIAPDGSCVLWDEPPEAGPARYVLYDLQTGQPRWRRAWPANLSDPLFTRDSQWLLAPRMDAWQLEVIAAATGTTERTIPLPLGGRQPLFSRDGRTLLVTATLPKAEPFWLWAKILEWLPKRPDTVPMMTVHMFDFAMGEPVGEAACEDMSECWLTDDRRSLLTVYQEFGEFGVQATTIRCWDVPPQRPLGWIAGVPVGLGLALVSLRYGWRWWRRPRRG